MSFNVYVISEDFRNDQHSLKPIIQKLLFECGKAKAKVRCDIGLMRGVVPALDSTRLLNVVSQYKNMANLFILCVDRDGDVNRQSRLHAIETEFNQFLGPSKQFFATNAWQEVEVWILAGHDFMPGWDWQTIRNELHPKEVYYEPFAEAQGVSEQPGGGRKQLAEKACERYDRMKQLCSEDLADLEFRIRGWIESSSV